MTTTCTLADEAPWSWILFLSVTAQNGVGHGATEQRPTADADLRRATSP
jgi:hypothetical protein